MRTDPPRTADNAPETRLYGLNACLAAFAHRPDALRKVYLVESRMAALRDVLAWCVRHRIGYRLVEESDLDKLTASRHHEGVCFDMRRAPPLAFEALLADEAGRERSLLLWLDGVGNPHNLGALLRTAHAFGAAFAFAIAPDLRFRDARRADTSAAPEHLPFYTFGRPAALMLPQGCALVGVELLEEASALPSFRHPQQAAYVLGPERGALSPELAARCQHLVRIPAAFSIRRIANTCVAHCGGKRRPSVGWNSPMRGETMWTVAPCSVSQRCAPRISTSSTPLVQQMATRLPFSKLGSDGGSNRKLLSSRLSSPSAVTRSSVEIDGTGEEDISS